MRPILATLFALVFFAAADTAYAAPPNAKDLAFDARIHGELAERDPDGAALFARANEARERGDHLAARDLLQQVRARDPWFIHATRRLCGEEDQLGHASVALDLCEEAYTKDKSPYNAAALSSVLQRNARGDYEDSHRALALAKEAAKGAPEDVFVQFTLAQVAMGAKDRTTLNDAIASLRHIAPHDPMTLYIVAFDEAMRGDLDTATRDLEEAKANGLPLVAYQELTTSISRARSPYAYYAWRILPVVSAWVGWFALLLGLGAALSAATMRLADRMPVEATGRARGADAWVRRAYRLVLVLLCFSYYVSLPLVALSVVGLLGGAILLFLAIGQIPIKLILIGLLVAFVSLSAMVRSLFARGKDADPGERLPLDENPKLHHVLLDIAARVGTRPVDSVYVTPGTEVAVLERGGIVAQLRSKSERCLILGVGVLDGMRVRELKAILAHEYGHFQNEDTAGGGLALAVRRSLFTFTIHMARGGGASWVNPAWWFVRGFNKVFHRVSFGATRLQEILADRWAAFTYGSEAFARGLTHVVAQSTRFDAHVNATLGELVPARAPLANLYAYVPKTPIDASKVDEAIAEAMSRPASPYDSHPPPARRIAWVKRLGAEGASVAEDDGHDAWTLLRSREAIEALMTDVVRRKLAEHGTNLPAAAPAA